MKVLTVSPVDFISGDALAPEDLNEVYNYARDAVIDAASKRWAKSVLVLQCVEAVDVPYTQAMNTEELTYRFTCPTTCIVERGFFHGNFTCTAELKVNITKTSGGTTPTGCTVPWLTSAGSISIDPDTAATNSESTVNTTGVITDDTLDTSDINVDTVLLDAGSEYQITISGGGTFSLLRFDLILHLATDRWNTAGTVSLPDFDPTLFNDASARDASVVSTNNSSLTTEASKFASAKTAPMPMVFVKHGLLSSTDADLRTFRIPVFDTARAAAKIKRIYLYTYTAGACTITATLKDSGGSTMATVTAVVTGTQQSADSGAVSLAIGSGATSPEDSGEDLTLEFANSSGAVNAIKTYAIVWLARA